MNTRPASEQLFVPATKAYLESLVRPREGEVRVGERIGLIEDWEGLEAHPAKYVLLGIPEDIGVRANYGVGGTHTLWEPALRTLLNTQQNAACRGQDLILLGAFHFEHWMAACEQMDAGRMRAVVDNIDEAVYPVIERIVRAGKIPIVIGGGHNNAYPLLQGTSFALKQAINCINLDAHCDYRRIEGRHSGNPFRYAVRDGYLNRYAIIGLHKAYNSAAVLSDLDSDAAFRYSFYEETFLDGKGNMEREVQAAIDHTAEHPTGIELDLDSIQGVLSSASTPTGVSSREARQYLRLCTREARVAYYHITEGAVRLRDGREDWSTAKLVAYLIRDIIEASKTDH